MIATDPFKDLALQRMFTGEDDVVRVRLKPERADFMPKWYHRDKGIILNIQSCLRRILPHTVCVVGCTYYYRPDVSLIASSIATNSQNYYTTYFKGMNREQRLSTIDNRNIDMLIPIAAIDYYYESHGDFYDAMIAAEVFYPAWPLEPVKAITTCCSNHD